MIKELASTTLKTRFGEFTETLFYDGQSETIALHMGTLKDADNTICRLHSACVYGHYFNSLECDCQQQMDEAQQQIGQQGKGIIILLDQEGKGNGHLALMKSKVHKAAGMRQAEAYEAAGYRKEARDFSVAAKILNHFGVKSVVLMSENKLKINTLIENGINVFPA